MGPDDSLGNLPTSPSMQGPVSRASSEEAPTTETEAARERPFFPDDLVASKADQTQLGVIERTHGEVDTHEPYPERAEGGSIAHDRDIPKRAFRQFLKDGIPPKGTALVRWESRDAAHLIEEVKLKLLDRSILIGDVVKRGVHDAMSGVVINTFTKCTLQPTYDISYRETTRLKGILPPAKPQPGIKHVVGGKPPEIIDVPACELQYSDTPSVEDVVIYKDWVGTIVEARYAITLRLGDNCVVEISDDLAELADGSEDTFSVGDIAMTKKGALRNGRWIFGQYNPNTHPIGTVVETRLVLADVAWLQRRIGSTNEREPPQTLERDELESTDFAVYDKTRRPLRCTAGENAKTLSNSEIDVQLGLRVIFRDLTGACVKYDKLSRIDRTETLGYDMNVFDVTSFNTEVTVQWQDLSITKENSIDLIPDALIEDEHAAWPSEVAHLLDVKPVPGMENVEAPSKVGVIQSVNAVDRMTRIAWCRDASVLYSSVEEEGINVKPLVSSNIGYPTGEEEEVSLYDLEAPAALNVRRGDIVFLAKLSRDSEGGGAPGPETREWLGEIVDTCLNGQLVLRLGAADKAKDVVVRREDVIVAIRSDGTGGQDGWAGESEDEIDNEEWPEYDEWGNLLLPDSFYRQEDGNGDEEIEAEATYEDEDGHQLDRDDVETGDWESADEEGDVNMSDAVPAHTPPTPTSATPPAASHPDERESNASSSDEPPQYQILEADVPSSHAFASQPPTSSPQHLKRTQKEHQILQKPGALPASVYVRTWDSRLDLLRVLIIGAQGTPYRFAPFITDLYLPSTFPSAPPSAFFHSWPGDAGLGGVGRVNPNLYEDGKICLSLLGTWDGNPGESWNAGVSTLLQVLVSLVGLVLVEKPYFNEAGYEHLVGLESSRRPSALYSERVFLRARSFLLTAVGRVRRDGVAAWGLEGLGDVVRFFYLREGGDGLLAEAIKDVEAVLGVSDGVAEPDGLGVLSKGACVPLVRILERMREMR
ncbi:hypothetical protein EJ03DRAFT_286142 [Teratosphaeria nubilosa]|uniref:UBC core domain-containing protein n=1 Tax=Teratosphaeria nubilosa TaxID=161662 RepID=A0A6G1LL22_9PEZI|nr:hypothetical protein EJ03DRAFT_286142 [Teratosphaeria nubilosa]